MRERALSSGRTAVMERDESGWTLTVGGFAQSHVGALDAPPKHAAARCMLAAAVDVAEPVLSRYAEPGSLPASLAEPLD